MSQVGGGFEDYCMRELDAAGVAYCEYTGSAGYARGWADEGAEGEGGLLADGGEVSEGHFRGSVLDLRGACLL